MCHAIAQAVWDYQGTDLSAPEKSILVRMAWYAAWNGTQIYPSLHTLSKQTNYSVSTIKRAILSLLKNKFLVIHKKSNKGKQESTHFRINFEKLQMPIPIELAKTQKKKEKEPVKIPEKKASMVHSEPRAWSTVNHGAWSTVSYKRLYTKTINKQQQEKNVCDEKFIEELEDQYSKEYVRQKVIYVKSLKNVRSFRAALVAACRDNWKNEKPKICDTTSNPDIKATEALLAKQAIHEADFNKKRSEGKIRGWKERNLIGVNK